jgi:hypothetical protein
MVYQKSPVLVCTILREGYSALLTEKMDRPKTGIFHPEQ